MITSGVLVSANRMNSKYGGHVHKCRVICKDKDRTLWADPKMVNWKHWKELVETINSEIMQGRGFVLDNLKVLKKNDERLDADVQPDLVSICKLEDLEPRAEDSLFEETSS